MRKHFLYSSRQRYLNRWVLLLLTAVCLSTACRDEGLEDPRSTLIEEGLPTEISLSVAFSEMEVRSRALIDDEGANRCSDIWVGVYQVSTGERVAQQLFDVSSTFEKADKVYPLGSIPGITGQCYIVGIANVTTNEGVMEHSGGSELRQLDELLVDADTWEKLNSVSVALIDTTKVDYYAYNLLMSGSYVPPTGTDTGAPQVVEVGPDTNSGTIYLHRLVSYNKFELTIDPNITFEPRCWQVFNVPILSALVQQDEDITKSSTYLHEKYGDNFGTSHRDYSFLKEENVYSFDFYQFENRHTACDYVAEGSDYVGIRPEVDRTSAYADREREFKTEVGINTGVYRSLVASNDASDWNNRATFVEISAKVSYYIDRTEENILHPEEAAPVAYDATKNQIYRSGEVKYTVHLGYCENKEEGQPTYATACDFNCFRNTYYTYHVTVKGLNKIVVEAVSKEELQSGAEGDISDSPNKEYELDAHYNTFNIQLSNQERSTLKYALSVPFGRWNLHSYESSSYQADWENDQFYTWIKFKPTKDELTLALYHDGTETNDLWSLNDLKDLQGHPGYNGSTDAEEETQQWYTVFIDEYVYTKDENGTELGESGWGNFINLSDRKVLIYLYGDLNTSGDTESHYAHAKYALTQRSIQSFYAQTSSASTAFGVEHFNETYGLNFRWTPVRTSGFSPYNGRYNTMFIITNNSRVGTQAFDYQWSRLVDFTTPTIVYADYNSASDISHDASVATIPALAEFSTVWRGNSPGTCAGDPSPNDNRYYVAMLACMSRNRDLNGDGRIDMDEMRWYLPAFKAYEQIVLGQNALRTPLMDYTKYSKDYFDAENIHRLRPYFHYLSSSYDYLWAEEGMSQGGNLFAEVASTPYNLRCVRNLGTDLSQEYPFTGSVNTGYPSDVERAYSYDASTNYFTMEHYNTIALRSPTLAALSAHNVSETPNDMPYQFRAAANYVPAMTDRYDLIQVDANGYLQFIGAETEVERVNVWTKAVSVNSPCYAYSENSDGSDKGKWRLPNQKELALMETDGLMSDVAGLSSTNAYFVSYPSNTAQPYAFFGCRQSGYIALDILKDKAYYPYIKMRCVRDVVN